MQKISFRSLASLSSLDEQQLYKQAINPKQNPTVMVQRDVRWPVVGALDKAEVVHVVAQGLSAQRHLCVLVVADDRLAECLCRADLQNQVTSFLVVLVEWFGRARS